MVSAHRAYHRLHEGDEAVGIGAALLPPHHADEPFARWLEASGELYGTSFHAGMERVPDDFFYVGNASVKRAFLERAGRFDDRFAGHAVDDYELGLRLSALGMRAGYVPEALAVHEHPLTLRERCETMRRAGEAARVFEASHGVPQAWRRALGRSPWRHRIDALRHRIGHGLTRSPRQRARYYRSLLRANLSAGYRSAVADA